MNPLMNLDRGPLRTHDPVILFVDDEPAVLQSIRRSLRNEPYEVITAGSGDEALGWLEELPVDLVITDQRMPSMKGTELLQIVQERFPEISGALLTVDHSESVMQEGLEAGAKIILYKAEDDQILRESIRRLLRVRARRRPGNTGEDDLNC